MIGIDWLMVTWISLGTTSQVAFLQEPHVIDRLSEFPWLADQYLVLRKRVYAALKMKPARDRARTSPSGDDGHPRQEPLPSTPSQYFLTSARWCVPCSSI
jgi:hypothetical protein